jgi:microsomal dipeptidase-like Zn-dependent dipeptidase
MAQVAAKNKVMKMHSDMMNSDAFKKAKHDKENSYYEKAKSFGKKVVSGAGDAVNFVSENSDKIGKVIEVGGKVLDARDAYRGGGKKALAYNVINNSLSAEKKKSFKKTMKAGQKLYDRYKKPKTEKKTKQDSQAKKNKLAVPMKKAAPAKKMKVD